MAYLSLYRKYRPQSFADVVGQTHVTQTLVNAIDEDRLHHAYLFTGPRGTGKTSTARILAKAVNCEEGPTSTPCNRCELCVEITTGSSVDVIELDMASHGGVDDARELRDRALFAPARGRKKVYILDEVHMASTAAFNALLKLIEEPPGHVIFAMATTDPQKVLPTIMSRVQRLDLRRVAASEVGAHVCKVVADEGYTIEDSAVEAVVRAGDGSVRDTLSVLEQVLSFSGTEVTAEKVFAVLGHTPVERAFETVQLVADRDLGGLLALVQRLVDDGHDLRRFAFDLLQHLRDLLVLQVAPDHPDLVDATEDRRARLADQANLLPRESLLRAFDLLADTVTEMRQGPPRLPLELVLAKLAVPELGGDAAGLADRVARLESGVSPAGSAQPARRDGSVAQEPETTAVEAPAREAAVEHDEPEEADDSAGDAPDDSAPEQPAVDEPSAETSAEATEPADEPAAGSGEVDLDRVVERWPAVLELVKDQSRRVHAIYEPATPVKLRNRVLTLEYGPRYASFHAQNAPRSEFANVLSAALEQSLGQRLKVDAKVAGEATRPQPPLVTTASDQEEAPEEGPTEEEQAAVREAEVGAAEPVDVEAVVSEVDQLVTAELDAEKLDEQPPQG
ncbi:MAG: DNA polymerase III subunit gamma/tau [Nitriliruptorales bacterium]|nr:DNA polymerase III subunit gamma/tau [Nitriliruptorales bacterium]